MPVLQNGKCALYRVVHTDSGKSYVGISTNPDRRWRQHQSLAASGKNVGCAKFYAALRKYGPKAFSFAVIALGSSKQTAGFLEMAAIKLGMGDYNLAGGGAVPHWWTGQKHSAETRAKMSRSMKGKKHYRAGTRPVAELQEPSARFAHCRTEGHRDRCRKLALSGKGKPGRKASEETKRKMRLAASLRSTHRKTEIGKLGAQRRWCKCLLKVEE